MAYTYDQLLQWAAQFFPAFRFSRGPGGEAEVFYPVEVDSWLRHQLRADASQAAHLRGTALYRWRAAAPLIAADQWRSQTPVVASGALTLDANAQTGIGHDRFAAQPPEDPASPQARKTSEGDWYLDFGGWNDATARSAGQLGYAWTLYAPVFDQLGLPSSVRPVEPDGADEDLSGATPPARFDAPRDALHTYVEFGPIARIIDELIDVELPAQLSGVRQGRATFQDNDTEKLQDLIGLTYNLFYPVFAPRDHKLMEGQWEAVTLLLRDEGGGSMKVDHASYSQGYENRGFGPGLYPRLFAHCHSANAAEIEWEGTTHPVVYVAWGSHANYFTPRSSEQSIDPEINWGVVILSGAVFVAAALVAIVGAVFIVVGVLCLVGTIDIAVPCWALIVIGAALIALAVAMVVGAVALLAATAASAEETQLPFDETPRDDSHGGEGAATNVGAVGPPDAPPVTGGSSFIMHPVSADPNITDRRAVPPAWWRYVGRWGVCVDDAAAQGEAPSWSNGAWRRRPDGYTPTHRNLEAFIDHTLDEHDHEADAVVAGW